MIVKQLKQLALDTGMTQQDLMVLAANDLFKSSTIRPSRSNQQALIAEGINHVLAKYGKPTVAT